MGCALNKIHKTQGGKVGFHGPLSIAQHILGSSVATSHPDFPLWSLG